LPCCPDVSGQHGNYDYLVGYDVDMSNPQVSDELLRWGRWFVDSTRIDGFRLDALKHIPASFYPWWLAELRQEFRRELFAVGEYWSKDVEELQSYLAAVNQCLSLFDVPLHYNFQKASEARHEFDMTQVFQGSLVATQPILAVTFVDNHDTQPGQSLESCVKDWFKPLAYALILLRRDGYPCVFYGDYFGNEGHANPVHKLTSHRKLIDDFLQARARYAYGEQHDYLDHPSCIGWVWTGDAQHPGSMVVLMSTGDQGTKKIHGLRPRQIFRDLTGHCADPVMTDDSGGAEFRCPSGNVSVWCTE